MVQKHLTYELADYIAGALSSEEARRVEEHLKSCARCRKEYEVLSVAMNELKEYQWEQPSQEYFSSLASRIQTSVETSKESKRKSFPESRLAFALQISIMVIGIFSFIHFSPFSKIQTPEYTNVVSVQSHEEDSFSQIALSPFDLDTQAELLESMEYYAKNVLQDSVVIKEALTEGQELFIQSPVFDYNQIVSSLDDETQDVLLSYLEERM
ncbi:MAG: zf-HC2 domain-containing protein [Bacteroidetes bacterium]|nr:zf-HC2 domain-containing protein [Bacteroidota bacterium]